MSKVIKIVIVVVLGVFGFYITSVLAAPKDISGIADVISGTFESLGKLMIAAAYLAGFGLTIAAIFKFKQHKDNPQQTPMGTPITMLLVGIALIFLPNIIQPAGSGIFGEGAVAGGFKGEGLESIPGSN